MAKDIDKILEDFVFPEMEYVKTKHSDEQPAEVPEVVLPKTKEEMYNEAKGRLKQKTSPVSKAYKDRSRQQSKKRGNSAARETAAATTVTITKTGDRIPSTNTIERSTMFKRIVEDPQWVGGADEIIPFAWRKPLVEVERPSKLYRVTMREERAREHLLPVPRER